MFVIGTAGHIDHGKSVLVRALTGIDPDRLPEEKQRGMTIDLGFAWLSLPSGRLVSIVDVPGHERFIKNMLAGVGGIDLALLVIAADECVMPQTREHLAILDLLQVERGIVVITKKDLVDDEWLELVALDVRDAVNETTLASAPILAVSGIRGDGLPELVSTIDRILDATPPKRDIGRPRLPIDRVFSIAGFGTVVTGTLVNGCLSAGQELEIVPAKLKTRIRGMQTHKHKIDTALPGNRVAVNLAGLSTDQLKRGDVATVPGWLVPARAMDLKLRLLHSLPRPLRHNTWISFHTGSSEETGKIRLLEKDTMEPGETSWVQVLLTKPVVAVKGDFFVIRSPQETLGGGEIVGIHAKRHRRFLPSVVENLECMAKGTPEEIILTALQEKQPIELEKLSTQCNLSIEEAQAGIQALTSQGRVIALAGAGARVVLMTSESWERQVKQMVQNYHQKFPLRVGMPKDELRNKLKITADLFAPAVEQLIRQGVLVENGTLVCVSSHQVQLTKEQQSSIDSFITSLAEKPYSPSSDVLLEPRLIELLVEQGEIVKVTDNVVFLTSVYDEMVKRIVSYIGDQGKITVSEVKDLFKTSRKYAVALLEYLDAQKVTRRVGDERVLVEKR